MYSCCHSFWVSLLFLIFFCHNCQQQQQQHRHTGGEGEEEEEAVPTEMATIGIVSERLNRQRLCHFGT
jgi:hypothetical protein